MATSTLFSRVKKACFRKRVHEPPSVSRSGTAAECSPPFDETKGAGRKKKKRSIWSRFLPTCCRGEPDDDEVSSSAATPDAEDHLEQDVYQLSVLDTPVSLSADYNIVSAVPSTADPNSESDVSFTDEEEFVSAVSFIVDENSESDVSFTEDEEFLSAMSFIVDENSKSDVSFTDDEEFVSAMSCIADENHETVKSGSPPTKTAQITDDIPFDARYKVGDILGMGSFSTVYEGIRKKDNFKVALKYARKLPKIKLVHVPFHPNPVPLEIALAFTASGKPSPYIIQMLDWHEFPDHYVMVMEKPSYCMDLFDYMQLRGGICEKEAKSIMWQVIQAAVECCSKGVFHRDIKPENLLINVKTQEVKLIDFGCGDFMRDTYDSFNGTRIYTPPEYVVKGKYQAKPATVYTLGLTLFVLLHRFFPSRDDVKHIRNGSFPFDVSKECCRLIKACLEPNPDDRIPLEEMLRHDWMITVEKTSCKKKG